MRKKKEVGSNADLLGENLENLALKYGGFEYIPVEMIIKLQQVLVPSDDELEQQAIEKVRDILKQRRDLLFSDQIEISSELDLIREYFGEDDEEPKLKPVIESSKSDIGDKVLMTEKEVFSKLNKTFRDKWLVNNFLRILKIKRMFYSDNLEFFLKEIKGYVPLPIVKISESLGSSDKTIEHVLSSYLGDEIKNIVLSVNPYMRLNKFLYMIKEEVNTDDILPGLKVIKKSLEKGSFSYLGVSGILSKRRMSSDHTLFDPVIETVFKRKKDGTYSKASVEAFEEKSEGYRFIKLKRLLRGQEIIDKTLEAISTYDGDLVMPISLEDAPSLTSEDSDIIYLFKYNEEGNIDLNNLGKEIGLDIVSMKRKYSQKF